MPTGSSAPRYTVDVVIACVMEALVGFSELTMLTIDKQGTRRIDCEEHGSHATSDAVAAA